MFICKICQYSCNTILGLSNHITKQHKNITKEEYYLKYINPNIGLCNNCNINKTRFININLGYKKYCSIKCGNSDPIKLNKIKQTNLERYGVDNVSKNLIIKNKIINTNIERHGVKSTLSLDWVQEKIKQTNLKKFGTQYQIGSESTKNKIKNKIKKIYKVNNISQIKNVKLLKNKTILKRTYDNLKTNKFNEYIIPLFNLSEYIGIDHKNKYKFQCIKCGNTFKDHLDNGRIPRCYNCYPFLKISKGETEVYEYVKSILLESTEIIKSDRSIISPYEIDIYIPEYNLAIEFNGLYWHSELNGKNKNYHLNKTLLCNEKGIKLIHIFEDEWIEKSDIIKSIICNKFNLNSYKIYARKCKINKIDKNAVKKFLNTNHIQGHISSKYNLGLYYQDELVCVLSIGSSRFNKKYNYEIHRFCSKLNTTVIGGFSKLLKYFKTNISGSIITYADLRYGTGDIYLNNGFEFINKSKPNYFYFKSGGYKRYSRNKFQKNKLSNILENYDNTLSEWDNMKNNGYDRIWDCGNNVYATK